MQIDKITRQFANARLAKSFIPGCVPRALQRSLANLQALGICCLLGCLPGVGFAQTSSSPAPFIGGGEIQIAVNGQDEIERNDAYRVGLRWLLQRYANRSGEVGVINHEQTRDALATPENYVDAFEYARIPDGTSVGSQPASNNVRSSGIATHWLIVQYSVPALDKLVALTRITDASEESGESGSTHASASSDESLLWLLIQDDATEIWVSGEITPHVVVRLTELAGNFGTAIHFPTFDTTDLAMIGPETLEALDPAAEVRLRETANRYRYSKLVAGIVQRQVAGGWELELARLDLTDAERATDRLEAQAPTLDSALQVLAGWVSGVVDAAGKPLQSGSTNDDVPLSFGGSAGTGARIWFDGAIDGGSYRQIDRYLQGFEGLEHARMLEINGQGVLFEVSPRSALASISRALQAQTWLERGDPPQTIDQGQSASTQIADAAAGPSTTATTSPSTLSAPLGNDNPAPVPAPKADLYMRYVF